MGGWECARKLNSTKLHQKTSASATRLMSAAVCVFPRPETMEKLLKREKEVSTLTSQVEALKSQMGGKC